MRILRTSRHKKITCYGRLSTLVPAWLIHFSPSGDKNGDIIRALMHKNITMQKNISGRRGFQRGPILPVECVHDTGAAVARAFSGFLVVSPIPSLQLQQSAVSYQPAPPNSQRREHHLAHQSPFNSIRCRFVCLYKKTLDSPNRRAYFASKVSGCISQSKGEDLASVCFKPPRHCGAIHCS